MSDTKHLIAYAQKIVSAYVVKNYITPDDLSPLLVKVLSKLRVLSQSPVAVSRSAPLSPPLPIADSIQPDYIVCLENGRKLKLLKRHLWTHYGLTPEAYRKKWGLPKDYPMVAPNYAKRRQQIFVKR